MKTTTTLLVAAATLATVANADEYFTGDGTAYTLGQTSAGNCNMMKGLDFATTYYAALNDKQWNGLQNCGRCAEVSCDDDRCADKYQSITVQILDRCPECQYGDLDLSPTVFTALTGSTPSRYTIKWKFVDCPVSGNVNYCLKGGSNSYWTAVQPANFATGVKSLQINGQDTTMLGSAYYYLLDGASQTQTDLTSVKISLTDVNGNSIEDTVSLTADSCTVGSSQFPNSAGSAPSTQTQTQSSAPATTTPTPTPTPTTAAPTTSPPTTTPTQTQTPAPTTQTPAPTAQTPAPTTQTPCPTTVRPDSPATTAPTYQQEISPSAAPLSTTATPTTTAPAPATTIPVTTAPSTTAPATNAAATIAPANPSQESQSTYASTTGSAASPTAHQGSSSFNTTGIETNAPKSTTATKKTKSGIITTTPSTQQKTGTTTTGTSTTAAPSSSTQQTADSQADDYTQSANTKSQDSSSGTDWTIVGLSSAAGVGVVALIVVVVMVKRKQIRDEKARDFEAPSMVSVQSFDVQNTPADRARNFGVL